MPAVSLTNTNASTIMIAEKGCGDDHCRGATAAGGVKTHVIRGQKKTCLPESCLTGTRV
jgi:hypothetical protein